MKKTLKTSAWILAAAMIFTGCSQTQTALKMMDGLNYLSVHDLQDRVHYETTAQLPKNEVLMHTIDEAQPIVYGVLNKAVCSGSEKYIQASLFSFTPNKTKAKIEFPFGDILAENNSCLDVTKIYDFKSSDNTRLSFSVTLISEKQKEISVHIDMIKEEGRWCLVHFRKLG